MKQSFDLAAEEDLLRRYVAAVPDERSLPIREQARRIEKALLVFRQLYAGQSVLNHSHSSEWTYPWKSEASRWRARPQIEALGRWWSWLFAEGVLDDNVLGCFYPCGAVLDEDVPLVLTHNLQRTIATYLGERGPRSREHRRKLNRFLNNFNVFFHRLSTAREEGDGYRIDQALLLAWLRDSSRTAGLNFLHLAAGKTNDFLRFLVEKGRLSENPMTQLCATYGARHRKQLVAAIASGAPEAPLAPSSRFVSPLSNRLEDFIALKRAMGRRYDDVEKELRRFDRFVATWSGDQTVVTPQLIQGWIEIDQHLHPTTRRHRLKIVRQFCLYLVRHDPQTHIPDPALFPIRVTTFKPYIYPPDEFRTILAAALALPSPKAKLRPKTIYTVLVLLYGTGLRSGEALGLRLRDVDLNAATLMIHETKFFKTRIVPFSKSVAQVIREYLELRLQAAASPDAYLFLNYKRRPYSVDKFAEYFATILEMAGVPRVPRDRRPRVHCIRHTHAVTRLLRWYREGANVQAKLPLLATYLRHVDVLSTQVYLQSTAELLRAASERFHGRYGALITVEPEVNHVH